jgi:hypothetical protein
VLTADLLQKYGLPEDQVLDAVELAVTRTLSAALDTTVSVRAENGLEIVAYPRIGRPVEVPLHAITRKLRRHVLHNVELELQRRQALREAEILQELRGQVIYGTVGRIEAGGTLRVVLEIDEIFRRLILSGECPLLYQPGHERGLYRVGDSRAFHVTRVHAVQAGRHSARVRIQLSRTSPQLPELLLKKVTGVDGIVCQRRVAGGFSRLATPVRLPKSAINTVGKELGEHLYVFVAEKNER